MKLLLLLSMPLQTGTLTEDGLDMWGVVPVSDSKFQLPVKNIRNLPCDEHFLRAMVTCHGITMIDGSLAGDPLDIKVGCLSYSNYFLIVDVFVLVYKILVVSIKFQITFVFLLKLVFLTKEFQKKKNINGSFELF